MRTCSRKDTTKKGSQAMNYATINEVSAIANAAGSIPGFARMMWYAAHKLQSARFDVGEMREYEATHKTKGGKAYARLVRRQAASHEAFVTAVDAVCIVLEAANRCSLDHHAIHCAVLEEASEIAGANGASFSETYSRANGYL